MEKVSYSSIRSGTIDERENWIVVQQWFSRAFLARMFDEWVKSAAIVGTAGIRASEADKLQGASVWTGRRWPWVDPEGDANATEKDIDLGITSPSKVAAERGEDYATTLAAIEQDNKLREKHGLPPIGHGAAGKTAAQLKATSEKSAAG